MSFRRVLLSSSLVLAVLTPGCSDRTLVPVEDNRVTNYDNLVDIEAEFCTRTAEEVEFPVKILLVLDGSGSLQFTDQSGTRRAAVRDLMSALSTQPGVKVATMVFGSNIYVDPPIAPGSPTFIDVQDWQEPSFLGLADVQTNYHGGLAAIQSHLLMDMLQSDPAELARTKYVILFFSDGAPTPKCCISAEETRGTLGELPFGCAPEAWEVADPNLTYCEGEEEQTICNDPDWLDNFRNNNQGTNTPDYGDGTLDALNDLEPNDNYNRTYQIEDLILETVELGETFGVGELRFHTMLLFDSTLPDLVKQIYRLNRCKSAGLLARMAELGNGVFRDFENSEEIDFLSFNFTSLRRGYSLVANYAVNMSALPTVDPLFDGFMPDTDGDGLSDKEEFELGTHPAVTDSDPLVDRPPPTASQENLRLPRDQWGDGYSDRIEVDLASVGFDARIQSLPVTPCPAFDPFGVDQTDLDADGLNGCEEALFETDAEEADSDGDGLPDGLEVRMGLDPARHEGSRDDDFDGLENFKEVRRGSDPLVPDQEERQGLAYRYELIENGVTDDGRNCYVSKINDVRLVTTEPRVENGSLGYNDIYLFVSEVPTDNPTGKTDIRFACFRAQYIAPTYKDPPQGKITLTEDDFWDLANDLDVEALRAGADPCKAGKDIR